MIRSCPLNYAMMGEVVPFTPVSFLSPDIFLFTFLLDISKSRSTSINRHTFFSTNFYRPRARPSLRDLVIKCNYFRCARTRVASPASPFSLSNCKSSVPSADELRTSLCVNAAVAVAVGGTACAIRWDDDLSLIAPPRVARYRGLVANPADGLRCVTRRGLLPMHFK